MAIQTESTVTLTASPAKSLVDDDLDVTLSGLRSWQKVTLMAVMTTDNGQMLISHAHYVTDHNGCLDLHLSASHGGSFSGVEPVGLLWSMKPPAGQTIVYLLRHSVDIPLPVRFDVIRGFHDVTEADHVTSLRDVSVASADIERWFKTPDVIEIAVRSTYLRGRFFLPPGEGPFPGVVDLPGARPNCDRHFAALLASRGFATLTVAYFKFEDLPREEIVIHLESIEEAIEYVHSHPKVLKSGIAILGSSKGAAIAFDAASKSDKVKAIAAVCPPCVHMAGKLFYRGQPQPVVLSEEPEPLDEGCSIVRLKHTDDNAEHLQVEKCGHLPILFVQSEDDGGTLPYHMKTLLQRLDAAGYSDNYRVLSYPGAGHIFRPPYTPAMRVLPTSHDKKHFFGGETRAHAKAQEDAWRKLHEFLWQQLDAERAPVDNFQQHTGFSS